MGVFSFMRGNKREKYLTHMYGIDSGWWFFYKIYCRMWDFPGTLTQTGITSKKISLSNFIESSMVLKQSASYFKQRVETFLVSS